MKDELLKSCIDECKVLLKQLLLIFRSMLMDKTFKIKREDGTVDEKRLNVVPRVEAITIPSLAQTIYRNGFLPHGTSESFADMKNNTI